MNPEVYKKIIAKKEFSELPIQDVEMAYSHFEKRQTSEDEKIRLTRELLHKVYGAFTAKKLFGSKPRDFEWILSKHLSTRERFENYLEIYKRILKNLGDEINVVDLGAGVNGFSYPYFSKLGLQVNYLAVEAIGQFSSIMNKFFEKEKFKAGAFHFSLFDKEKIRGILNEMQTPRVVFLFKVIDCLEMLKKDYSKELLLNVSKYSERVVVSFATESMISRKKFKVSRAWILDFIKENFRLIDDFEMSGERFVVFEPKSVKSFKNLK